MSNTLTEYRKKHDLTLEAFGQKVGASKAMVWKWENGTIPRPQHMQSIIEECGDAVNPADWYASTEAA